MELLKFAGCVAKCFFFAQLRPLCLVRERERLEVGCKERLRTHNATVKQGLSNGLNNSYLCPLAGYGSVMETIFVDLV